jgi:hypothetical protein
MIKVECDKCGKSVSRCSYEIRVLPLINTTPMYFNEGGEANLTCEADKKIRFILCQDCYAKIGLPNVYWAHDNNELLFRNPKYAEKDEGENE